MWTGLICGRDNVSCSKEPKCTSKLSSTILTGALTHYQNNFRKLNVNQMRFSIDIRTCKTCTTRTSFANYLLTWRLAFKDDVQMENNSNFSQFRALKCSFQRKLKLSAAFANKVRNQFSGRGQSQALLRLRCAFCWFIWLKNINISRRWFLCLILYSSSTTRTEVIGLVK